MVDPSSCPRAVITLSRGTGRDSPYLLAHHVEAARAAAALYEKSRLRPCVTMHYGPRVHGSGGGGAADISDMAAEARKRLQVLLGSLPPDCAGIIADVCGMEKGLQGIEAERGWPRRSAKLVLRVALDGLAVRLGLTETAQGWDTYRTASWAEAYPDRFA